MFREALTGCLLAGALAFVFVACGGEDGGEDECAPCPGWAGSAVKCNLSFQTTDVCGLDQQDAVNRCFNMGGSSWVPIAICVPDPDDPGETGSSGGGDSWSPGRDIIFDPDAGEFVINREAFEELKLDPSPLLVDASHVEVRESGYFVVSRVGELADALGWESGDTLLDVNGYGLEDSVAFADAFLELEAQDEFRLTVERRQSKVVLRYRVE